MSSHKTRASRDALLSRWTAALFSIGGLCCCCPDVHATQPNRLSPGVSSYLASADVAFMSHGSSQQQSYSKSCSNRGSAALASCAANAVRSQSEAGEQPDQSD